jgi:hypothetical protein
VSRNIDDGLRDSRCLDQQFGVQQQITLYRATDDTVLELTLFRHYEQSIVTRGGDNYGV